jgi:hypothetical protein
MADSRFGNTTGEGGKEWGRGTTWSDEDMALVQEHYGDLAAMRRLFPGRTLSAIRNAQARARYQDREKPPVKPPGTYIHVLAGLLVDEFECMEIWCKWNGYASYKVLGRDRLDYVTVACQAK